MFISKTQVDLPSQKVITELASRNGLSVEADRDALSPYTGQLSAFLNQFLGQNSSTSLLVALEQDNECEDYDADKDRPTEAERTGPQMEIAIRGDGTYLRKFDGENPIPASYLEYYLKNTCISMKKRERCLFHRTESAHLDMTGMVDSESGRVTASNEQISVDYSGGHEKLQAIERLPYVMKRLLTKSCELRTHIFSLVIAYKKSLAKYHDSKPGHILQFTVLKMDRNGCITGEYTTAANNGDFFPKAMKFLNGVNRDSYYDDLNNFIAYEEALGISIKDEDPYIYTKKYIDDVCCLYVTSNREYFARGRKFNKEVYDSLREISLDTMVTVVSNPEAVLDPYQTIDNTMSLFLGQNSREELQVKDDITLATYITLQCQANNAEIASLDSYVTIDGFLFQRDGKSPALFNVSRIYRNPTKTMLALLHVSGKLIIITDSYYYEEVSLYYATKWLEQLRIGYTDDTDFGRWEKVIAGGSD